MNNNFIKSSGKYWYKIVNNKKGKVSYNKCDCGNFKTSKSNKCFICADMEEGGFIKKKPDDKKKFIQNGYEMIYKPNYKQSLKNGYIATHRYKMIEKLGRLLNKDEVVHHIDRNTLNNNIDNLELMSLKEHNKLHSPDGVEKIRSKFKYKNRHRQTLCLNCNKWYDYRCLKCKFCKTSNHEKGGIENE